MSNAHSRSGQSRKVGQHLLRCAANGNDYAVFKMAGKKIWRGLEAADRELVERKLKDALLPFLATTALSARSLVPLAEPRRFSPPRLD